MVPGIDGAGTVLESRHPGWQPGDRFVHNGWGVGEPHWGCLAERARLKGDWLVKLPAAFTPRQAMAIGTAGYTAMLCVLALERHGLQPGDGEVLVTGATGGVGSVAIALLSRLGHRVTAASGKPQEADYLKRAGCRGGDRPRRTRRRRASRCRRNAGPAWWTRWAATRWSMRWRRRATAAWWRPAAWRRAWTCRRSVAPFILRGVTLAGVDSVMAPRARRQAGLGPPGARPRPGAAGAHDERDAAGRGAGGGRAADRRADARALRGAHRLTPRAPAVSSDRGRAGVGR